MACGTGCWGGFLGLTASSGLGVSSISLLSLITSVFQGPDIVGAGSHPGMLQEDPVACLSPAARTPCPVPWLEGTPGHKGVATSRRW